MRMHACVCMCVCLPVCPFIGLPVHTESCFVDCFSCTRCAWLLFLLCFCFNCLFLLLGLSSTTPLLSAPKPLATTNLPQSKTLAFSFEFNSTVCTTWQVKHPHPNQNVPPLPSAKQNDVSSKQAGRQACVDKTATKKSGEGCGKMLAKRQLA